MRPNAFRVMTTVVALAAVVPASETLAGSGRKLYDEGARAFEARDYETAAKLFAEAFAVEPDPAYVFSEASAHRRMGNAVMSAMLYEKYLAVVPGGERVEQRAKARAYAAAMRLSAAKALKEKGDCGGAIDQAHKALGHDKTKGEAWILVADCTAEKGDELGSRTSYERALSTTDLSPELREHAESRIAALKMTPEPGPAARATTPPSETGRKTPAKEKGAPILGIVAGMSGGIVVVGAVVLVVALAVRPGGSLDFPDTTLGIMDWRAR